MDLTLIFTLNFRISRTATGFRSLTPLSTPLTQGRPKSFLKDRKCLLVVSKSSYQVGTKTFCACYTHELRIVLLTIRKSVIPIYHVIGKSKQPGKFKLSVKERSDLKIMSLHLKSNFKKLNCLLVTVRSQQQSKKPQLMSKQN